jgi:hypothetical protein
MLKQLTKKLSDSKQLTIINATLLLIALLVNTYWQVFCIPSTWAIIVLIICFLNTIFYPLISKINPFLPITGFINGMTFFVFLYCIIFLEQINLIGLFLLLIGIGLIIFIPHFFAFQIFWFCIIKPVNKFVRLYFIIGFTLSIAIALFMGFKYKRAIRDIENFKKSNYEKLDKTYMTEKIMGMHFIYHTRFCEYD